MSILFKDLLACPPSLPVSQFKTLQGADLTDCFIKAGGQVPVGNVLTVKDLSDFLATKEDGPEKDSLLALEIDGNCPVPVAPATNIADAHAIKEIARPDKREQFSRRLVGGVYSFVMAYTIILFSSVVALVALDRKEFPSATLAAIIIVPTMMVAWYHMGIINKERRDILSAVVGDKISSSTLATVIEALRNRKS